MALIICPECGSKISDKSVACIHCGYPLAEESSTNSNKLYDVVLIECGDNKTKVIANIREIIKSGLKDAMDIVNSCPSIIVSKVTKTKADDIAKQMLEIGAKVKLIQYTSTKQIADAPIQQNIPKCPTCQSTNIKKISATSKATNAMLFGLFGNKRKKQFHCNSCGYEW